MKGFFVTGTDTDVGKTLVACALMHALAAKGLRVVPMKPVSAGGEMHAGRVMNADVIALQGAANVEAPLELVNPYAFEQPIAPHIAAQAAGVTIDVRRLKKTYVSLAALADCVVVEGAGGFRVPLSPRADVSDLAALLGLPVVIVVGMRLGCLNHALLTADAVRAAGLRIAGWVANHIDREMPYADDNVAALRERLDAPLIARVPFSDAPAAENVASLVNVSALRVVPV